MLVACRLAGLSALGGHYAGANARAQSSCGSRCRIRRRREANRKQLPNSKVDVCRLYLLASPSTPTKTRQRARKRPLDGLGGVTKAQRPPAGKSGARSRTRARPPARACVSAKAKTPTGSRIGVG